MHRANASKPRLGPSPWTENRRRLLEYGAHAGTKSSNFEDMSDYVLDTMTSTRNAVILHIQPEGFPDHLLRLHIFLQNIGKHRLYSIKERKDIALGAVIVVDSLDSNNIGFQQACWVASERTNTKGDAKCGGAAYLFGKDSNIAVIRGLAMNDQNRFNTAVSRLGQAIKNVMNGMRARGFVWHECTTITLLARTLQEISNKNERNINLEYFKAVCCTSGLTIAEDSCTVKFGFENGGARDILLDNLDKARISLLFFDHNIRDLPPRNLQASSLNIGKVWNPCASHLPYFSLHWPRLVPISSWRPLLAESMDALATTIFRLRAASVPGGIGDDVVVQQVERELGPNNTAINLVKPWAKRCINSSSYSSSALMNLKLHLGTELWQACLSSNCPVDFALDSLLGGLIDPGTKLGKETMAIRIDIDFSSPSIRINAYSRIPTYILIPTSSRSSFVAEHLNQSWENLITTYPNPAKNTVTIPKQIAESVEVLVVAAMKNLQAITKSQAYQLWGGKEKTVFEYLIQAVWGGDAVKIIAQSLGRHPMAVFSAGK